MKNVLALVGNSDITHLRHSHRVVYERNSNFVALVFRTFAQGNSRFKNRIISVACPLINDVNETEMARTLIAWTVTYSLRYRIDPVSINRVAVNSFCHLNSAKVIVYPEVKLTKHLNSKTRAYASDRIRSRICFIYRCCTAYLNDSLTRLNVLVYNIRYFCARSRSEAVLVLAKYIFDIYVITSSQLVHAKFITEEHFELSFMKMDNQKGHNQRQWMLM